MEHQCQIYSTSITPLPPLLRSSTTTLNRPGDRNADLFGVIFILFLLPLNEVVDRVSPKKVTAFEGLIAFAGE